MSIKNAWKTTKLTVNSPQNNNARNSMKTNRIVKSEWRLYGRLRCKGRYRQRMRLINFYMKLAEAYNVKIVKKLNAKKRSPLMSDQVL